jgi:hypothetical protein
MQWRVRADPVEAVATPFLVAAGLFFAVSRLDAKRWGFWTAVAFAAGAAAATFALTLRPSLGAPTALHWGALGIGIAFEVAGIVWANRRFAEDERKADLAVLIVVGLHFLPMVYAIGPLIGLLGLICVANAALAWVRPHYSTKSVGLVDASLKIAFGLAMAVAHPVALPAAINWS